MKLAKPLLITVGLLVLVVAIVAVYLLKNLDAIIEGVVEDVGTRLTGTAVTLEGVELDLTSGKGTLNGLVIGNPRGYSSDYAFSLDKVVVGLQPASLAKPVIIISEVTIRGARLIAEQKGEKVNLSEILDNVEKASASEPGQTTEEPTGEAEDVRLAMQEFVFADTQATVITDVKGEASLQVPDVRRSNIGDPATGLTPAQLADSLLHAVIEEVQRAVGDYLAELAKDAARDKIREKMGLSEEEAESVEGGLRKLLKRE